LATLSLLLSKTSDARHRASSAAPYGCRFIRDDSGVTSIEYALITAVISVVAIAAMTFAAQHNYWRSTMVLATISPALSKNQNASRSP
jgi:Flp pilus assembly pilin Flp